MSSLIKSASSAPNPMLGLGLAVCQAPGAGDSKNTKEDGKKGRERKMVGGG
jgi:hypothetical protein